MEAIKKQTRAALGRGLSALISSPVPINPINTALSTAAIKSTQAPSSPENTTLSNNIVYLQEQTSTRESPAGPQAQKSIRYIAVNEVVNNPSQPRQTFLEAELNELAGSIRTLGVLQPVLVRPSANQPGKFEIVAGERRWRASQLAGLSELPAIVKEMDDRQSLEIALVENVQRANLNPVEEALAYQRLMSEFTLTQQEIAERVGKDRASIANSLRLLRLPELVLEMLRNASLSMGHAKVLLALKDPGGQISLAKKVINDALSVRELEAIVARTAVLDSGKAVMQRMAQDKQQDEGEAFPAVVDRMRNVLGTKVRVQHHASGRGKILIEYFSEQELDRLVEHLCR